MNIKTAIAFCMAAGVAVLSGCASSPRKQPQVAASIGVAPIQSFPAPVAQPAPLVAPGEEPIPIYVGPKIVSVYMDAYQNERGEIILPSEKRVIREPGRWNLDAARNPERSYIPAENVAPALGQSGWSAMSFPGAVATVEMAAPAPAPGATTLAGLQNPNDVRILRIFEPTREAEARAMLNRGETLVLDPALGYIALPNERLVNTPVAVPGLKETRRYEQPSVQSSALDRPQGIADVIE